MANRFAFRALSSYLALMKVAAIKVAIQGELGSFSHEAAEQMLPGSTVVPCARSVEAFDRIESGSAAAAVIPIENSLAGTVAEHADLLVACDVFIQAEFPLRIVHNVIAAPGVKLGRCAGFFRIPWRSINAAISFATIPRLSRYRSTTRQGA